MSGTILVVDDDGDIRDVVRIALVQAGYHVEEAADGRAALTTIERLKPDLVVLDIGLPEIDGLEVCRTVRVSSDVPILFLTAQGDEIDPDFGARDGRR